MFQRPRRRLDDMKGKLTDCIGKLIILKRNTPVLPPVVDETRLISFCNTYISNHKTRSSYSNKTIKTTVRYKQSSKVKYTVMKF